MTEQSSNLIVASSQIESGLTVLFKNEESYIFSENEISHSHKLAHIIKSIHEELLNEGYIITDGKVYFEGKQVYGRVKKRKMIWQ